MQTLFLVHGESTGQGLVLVHLQHMGITGNHLDFLVHQVDSPVVTPGTFLGNQLIGFCKQFGRGQTFVHRREFSVGLVAFQNSFGLIALIGSLGQFDFIVTSQQRHPADFF